jgi:hypothetical protein
MDRRTEYQVRPLLEQYGLIVLVILILPILPGGSILGRIVEPLLNAFTSLLVGI